MVFGRDDPEIAAAGQAFDRDREGPWFREAVVRARWPIYNWIDDYVVKVAVVPTRIRPERVFGTTTAANDAR